jgi:nitric oxide dioxygenase
VRSARQHAFKERVSELVDKHPEQIKTAIFYTAPGSDAHIGKDYHFQGRMDLAKVDPTLLYLEDPTAQYYLCGPEQFMENLAQELKARGVDSKRLHAEVFGAGSVAL